MEKSTPSITVVCREMSKDTGDIASYLCKENVSDSDVTFFSLRGRVNPELRYYAFVDEGKEKLEKVLNLLKRKKCNDNGELKALGVVRI